MSENVLDELDGIFTDLGEATIVPPKWIIRDLLPTGLVFVGAPPKSGKSTLEMAMSLLTAGLPCKALPSFLSQVDNPGLVMGWSYEASAGELRDMCENGLGTKVPDDKRILIADDPWLFRLDDPDGTNKLLHWLNLAKPKLAWLDPLRDFHNLEEKDSGGMNRILRPLQRWAKDNDCCMLVIHHTKKKDEGEYTANDLRGTTAIFGIADGVLMLTPKGNGLVNLKATFKRAAGWDRTIRIAAYDYAEAGACEQLGDIEQKVLKLIQGGATSIDAVAMQLKLSKQRARASVDALIRNGLLEGSKYAAGASKRSRATEK